jgi:radical SAM protein with 4Fe4S-binding SPASM domain
MPNRYPCNLPWLAPAINWDGKVTSCCVNFMDNELILGDIKKQSLKEIYQGKKFGRLREAHLKQDFSDYPVCRRCTYWQQLPNMGWRLR